MSNTKNTRPGIFTKEGKPEKAKKGEPVFLFWNSETGKYKLAEGETEKEGLRKQKIGGVFSLWEEVGPEEKKIVLERTIFSKPY